jgi:hypothetical protein
VALAALAALALALTGCGKAGGGSERSAESYCDVWKREATRLHDKYQAAADGTDADPFGSLLTVAAAPGDLVVLFDKLAKVAPDEIQSEVETIHDSLKDQQDAMGDAIDNPIGAIGSSLISGLTNAGSYQAVEEYTTEHCGSPPYS